MPEPATARKPGDDIETIVVQVAAIVAAVVFAAPVLVIAVPLAIAIDECGWRRWPLFVTGAAATAAIVFFGGWEAYLATAARLFHHWHDHTSLSWTDPLGFAPLAIAVGLAGGPILQVALNHHNEHEETRHRRELSDRNRARVQAGRRITTFSWPEPPDRTVLGLRLDGSIRGWLVHSRLHSVVAPPIETWARHALILGETGSGKTVTALTLASEALRLGWDVHWIDGKADRDTRQAFLAAAANVGVDSRDGFIKPIDGWRGGPDAVVNRLLATQLFSEPYYEGIARTVLRAAVGAQPPRSLTELVDRIDKKLLARALRDDRRAAELLHQLPDREIAGVRFRYDGIAWAIGGALDGDWSYEDTHASYVPVGRPENRHQSSEIGAFILEDLLHWALARKPRDRRALVIIDEFSKMSDRPGAAVDLVERVRSAGVGVVLVGQTWASIGPDEATRQRLAGTVGTIIVHQLKQPDEVAGLAGTEWTLERTEQTRSTDHTGLGSQRVGNRYVMHPDDVRALPRGEAFAIHSGRTVRIQLRRESPNAPASDNRGLKAV